MSPHLSTIYLAGFLATALISWAVDRRADRRQRNPLSCHLLLACVWPLFLAFLGCSAWVRLQQRRFQRTAGE